MTSILIIVPGALRDFTGGEEEVRLAGNARSVADALALLWSRYPGVRDRMISERGELRPHINIFLDGDNIRRTGGLDAPVRDGSEIVILPAVSGGAPAGAPLTRLSGEPTASPSASARRAPAFPPC